MANRRASVSTVRLPGVGERLDVLAVRREMQEKALEVERDLQRLAHARAAITGRGNREFFLHLSMHGRTAANLEGIIDRTVQALA